MVSGVRGGVGVMGSGGGSGGGGGAENGGLAHLTLGLLGHRLGRSGLGLGR